MPSAAPGPDDCTRLAAGLIEQGQPRAAEDHCRAALAQDPDHIGALSFLGLALHAQGRHEEAEFVYTHLAALRPSEALHWMNIGTARRCAGRLDEALYAFTRASALGANSADFYYNVALAHVERNDFESARALLARAFALAPEDTEIRFRYAQCCYECLRPDEALAALAGWEKFGAPNQTVAADIGHLLMKLGATDQAEPAVRKAAAEAGADAQARLTLVQVLERTNQVDEAAQVLAQLLADPRSTALGADLRLTQAQLAQRQGHHAEACHLYQEVTDGCKEARNRHFSLFPLAKALDAAGRYEEAYATLLEAHASQAEYLRQVAPVKAMRNAPLLSITEHSCDPGDIVAWQDPEAPTASASPVFIVAFPRSGTTLLELALDAHPQLRSMDEQPFLQNALDDLIGECARYPDQMRQLAPAQLDSVRSRYWERVAGKVQLAPGQRLVDKNPLNLLRLPALRRLFPNAHVILAIRHPCDVLLSCFMQHFRAPDFALLCRDLPTLALGYRRAFDFWYQQRALLRPDARELRYEQFVADFANQMRSVVDFLQLPWHDAVLAPGNQAQQKRFISTPSYSQVVQPVTDRAVGRWRRYERFFGEAVQTIAPYLARWDYAGLTSGTGLSGSNSR